MEKKKTNAEEKFKKKRKTKNEKNKNTWNKK
jgi:hypothetical protein